MNHIYFMLTEEDQIFCTFCFFMEKIISAAESGFIYRNVVKIENLKSKITFTKCNMIVTCAI